MNKSNLLGALSLTVGLWTATLAAGAQPAPTLATNAPNMTTGSKKLIQIGWDSVEPAYLRDHAAQMEASSPFNGLVVVLRPAPFGDEARIHQFGMQLDETQIFQGQAWPRAAFVPEVAAMKACKFKQFTDNFVRVNSTPGNLAWNDDRAWQNATTTLGNFAWFAKQGGLKGIFFDQETYASPLYKYQPTSGLSWEETNRLARKRGAQVMRAIGKEYPDITMMYLWFMTRNMSTARGGNVQEALKTDNYGLWPAFANGMLEAAPPQAKFVDATEEAYYARNKSDLLDLYNAVRNDNSPLQRLVSPELRAKYRAQVQAGQSVYADAYYSKPDFEFYIGPKEGGTELDRLREMTHFALDASDEYVWFYNESAKWWPVDYYVDSPANKTWREGLLPKTIGQGRPIEQVLPGITQSVAWAINPNKESLHIVSEKMETGALPGNLVANPTFSDQAPATVAATQADWKTGAVPGYASWQDDKSKGIFELSKEISNGADGSALVRGVSAGCLIQRVPVKAGQQYVVSLDALQKGKGIPRLLVRWGTDAANMIYQDEQVYSFDTKAENGWKRAGGVFTVPEGKTYAVALLLVDGQSNKDADRIHFDNFNIVPLETLLNPK